MPLTPCYSAGGFRVFRCRDGSAAWWVQLMSLAPIAVGLALVGLKSVEPLMIDAARMHALGYFQPVTSGAAAGGAGFAGRGRGPVPA